MNEIEKLNKRLNGLNDLLEREKIKADCDVDHIIALCSMIDFTMEQMEDEDGRYIDE